MVTAVPWGAEAAPPPSVARLLCAFPCHVPAVSHPPPLFIAVNHPCTPAACLPCSSRGCKGGTGEGVVVREPLVCVRTAGRSVLGQVSGLGVLGARDGAANEDVCPLLLAHSTAAGTL